MSAGASAGIVKVNGTAEDGRFVHKVEQTVKVEKGAHVVKQAAGTVRSILIATVHSAFTECADALYALGKVSQEERIGFSNAIGDALGALNEVIDGDASLNSASKRPVTADDLEAMSEWGDD